MLQGLVYDNKDPHYLLSKLGQKSLHFFSYLEMPPTNLKYNHSILNTVPLYLQNPFRFFSIWKSYFANVLNMSVFRQRCILDSSWFSYVVVYMWEVVWKLLKTSVMLTDPWFDVIFKNMYKQLDFTKNCMRNKGWDFRKIWISDWLKL